MVKEISFMDPVSDKFFVIDLINFDLNYLYNYWHLILKRLHFPALCFKHYMLHLNIFQIHQFFAKMVNQIECIKLNLPQQ